VNGSAHGISIGYDEDTRVVLTSHYDNGRKIASSKS